MSTFEPLGKRSNAFVAGNVQLDRDYIQARGNELAGGLFSSCLLGGAASILRGLPS
jgi:hypothetical protein